MAESGAWQIGVPGMSYIIEGMECRFELFMRNMTFGDGRVTLSDGTEIDLGAPDSYGIKPGTHFVVGAMSQVLSGQWTYQAFIIDDGKRLIAYNLV